MVIFNLDCIISHTLVISRCEFKNVLPHLLKLSSKFRTHRLKGQFNISGNSVLHTSYSHMSTSHIGPCCFVAKTPESSRWLAQDSGFECLLHVSYSIHVQVFYRVVGCCVLWIGFAKQLTAPWISNQQALISKGECPYSYSKTIGIMAIGKFVKMLNNLFKSISLNLPLLPMLWNQGVLHFYFLNNSKVPPC